jgi:flagellar FliJ protein
MTKTFSLQPLCHLAKQKNDTATRQLGLLNRNQLLAQDKLEMLQQYRRDYQEKMQAAERDGMGLQDLCNFRDFIYRLDDAISQQNTVVAKAKNSVQQGLEQLTDAKRKMMSFDTLAQRHTESEHKKEAKIEQNMQDEHNGRRAGLNNAAFDAIKHESDKY